MLLRKQKSLYVSLQFWRIAVQYQVSPSTQPVVEAGGWEMRNWIKENHMVSQETEPQGAGAAYTANPLMGTTFQREALHEPKLPALPPRGCS